MDVCVLLHEVLKKWFISSYSKAYNNSEIHYLWLSVIIQYGALQKKGGIQEIKLITAPHFHQSHVKPKVNVY